jgi:hypothetical protein
MSKALQNHVSAALLSLLLAASAAHAADTTTKDIVLDRVMTPIAISNPTTPARDAMVISVLLESPDGTLRPKSTNTLFRTGERFRIKLLASRDARVSFFNTNPRGETNPLPIWQGEVKVGLETVSARLALMGTAGVDQLHIVMEPAQETNIVTWLGSRLHAIKEGGSSSSSSKDIQLDVQNTPNATYLLNRQGQGLVNTVQIVHTAG